MATKRRGRCVYTQFDKQILCAGTLDKLFRIQSRVQSGSQPGQTGNPIETFTTVSEIEGKLEAVKYTQRFAGVATEDQSQPNFTHVGYISYDQTLYELDLNTFYVETEGQRNRRFKLKGIQDYDEESQWMQLQLAETGFSDLDGASG